MSIARSDNHTDSLTGLPRTVSAVYALTEPIFAHFGCVLMLQRCLVPSLPRWSPMRSLGCPVAFRELQQLVCTLWSTALVCMRCTTLLRFCVRSKSGCFAAPRPVGWPLGITNVGFNWP
jgi:hypothetical protein